tara:strand:- start:435 stop:599 length:165 start_codon:yes stop_codon:yes gene_type:complete
MEPRERIHAVPYEVSRNPKGEVLTLISQDSERYQALLEGWERRIHPGAHHFVLI